MVRTGLIDQKEFDQKFEDEGIRGEENSRQRKQPVQKLQGGNVPWGDQEACVAGANCMGSMVREVIGVPGRIRPYRPS